MALETATYIGQLNASDPTASDPRSQGDDHIRLVKSALQATFPNANGPVYFPTSGTAVTTDGDVTAPSDAGKILPVDASSGAVTVTLPTTGLYDGFSVTIIKTDFGPAVVTIDGDSKTVNGKSTQKLTKAYQSAVVTYSTVLSAWLAIIPKVVETGTFCDNGASSLEGYIMCDGAITIGDASSGATVAADYTNALFQHLWNSYAGLTVSSGRGSTSAADWAAHKKITMPDLRGRARYGRDNMGTAANRITAAGGGFDGTVLGGAGGAQGITMLRSDLPKVDVTVTGNVSGETDENGGHSHFMFSNNGDNSAPGTPVTSGLHTQYRAGGGGDFSYEMQRSSPNPTLGLTDAEDDHTHDIDIDFSTTFHLNGNVDQTVMKSLSPAYITNVFMAL